MLSISDSDNIWSFLIDFIEYKSPVLLYFTNNTFPTEPLPIVFMTSKSFISTFVLLIILCVFLTLDCFFFISILDLVPYIYSPTLMQSVLGILELFFSFIFSFFEVTKVLKELTFKLNNFNSSPIIL